MNCLTAGSSRLLNGQYREIFCEISYLGTDLCRPYFPHHLELTYDVFILNFSLEDVKTEWKLK
jgi:hypothetical protein